MVCYLTWLLSRITAKETHRDQELRFTVHDSADYYNLKVSVFNDDKRTDLIGETWINLEAVVIPGGGQGDSWHSLNCKGRYAGEIRIELTYYDIRPKIEKPRENGRERKQSESDICAPVQNAHMGGLQQLPPVRRRPLPPGPTHSIPSLSLTPERHSAAPLPQLAPRSYHNSPRQDLAPNTYSQGSEQTQYGRVDQSPLSSAAAYPRSLPNNSPIPWDIYYTGSGSIAPLKTQRYHGSYTSSPYGTANRNDQIRSQEPLFAEPDPVDDYMEYTDDPYALEVVEAGQDYTQQYETRTDATRLRNDRVQTLSSRPHYRPPIHHAGIPHAHSTPILGLHEQPGESQSHGNDHDWQMSESYESSSPGDASFGNISHQSPGHSPSFGPLTRSEHFGQPASYGSPPPPPIHSNSAPAVPGLAPRPPPSRYHTNQQGRPLHVPTSVHDLPPDPNQAQQYSPHQRRYPHTALFQPQPQLPLLTPRSHFPPERRRSEDPNMSSFPDPRACAHHGATAGHEYYAPGGPTNANSDPRRNVGSTPSRSLQNLNGHPVQLRPQAESHLECSSPQRLNMQGHSPRAIVPRISPRAVSPNMQLQQQIPPNFTLSARKSVSPQPASRPTAVPFSPDSYSSLNPHTARTPPTSTASRELSPMYISPPSMAPTPPQQKHDSPQLVVDGPIIGTDGRLIDPSDHLPLSSYAPEPERKSVNRPSAAINVKTRFGPRDARPTPISNPSSPTSSWNARASEPPVASGWNYAPNRSSGGSHSPLAPSPGNTVNALYPPPVPRKVPLSPTYSSGFGGGVEDYEPGGSMAALSQEIAGIDIGPGRSGRTRRSRFGA